ncbi:MAG: DNA topoisomerase IV, partial [Campylobacterota bacterium]|nr:DNA topoisomerase IV [Campylobacterota bacterium]
EIEEDENLEDMELDSDIEDTNEDDEEDNTQEMDLNLVEHEDALEELDMQELDEISEEDDIDESEENLSPIDLDKDVQIPEEATEPEVSDLETQIESAVLELTDEDLASELDEDALLNIAVSGMDGLDNLSTNDIKLAIGEEIEEAEEEQEVEDDDLALQPLEMQEGSDTESEDLQEIPDNGAQALKTLLKALSNEDVVASLKGMKISINITLGDG